MDFPDGNRESSSSQVEDYETFQPETMSGPTLTHLRSWYAGLSTPMQVVLGIAGLFIALGLINAIVHFVTSLLMLGILGVVFLILYRLFVSKT